MKEIFDAEIYVDTVFSIESGQSNGNWFRLADYGSLSEFHIDCASWFSDEENPEYVYAEWIGIPDILINRNWICPNIFELIDALQTIEMEPINLFVKWCDRNGYDLKADDPHLLVIRYQDKIISEYEPDFETTEHCEDANPSPGFIYGLTGQYGKAPEIFDDNYN